MVQVAAQIKNELTKDGGPSVKKTLMHLLNLCLKPKKDPTPFEDVLNGLKKQKSAFIEQFIQSCLKDPPLRQKLRLFAEWLSAKEQKQKAKFSSQHCSILTLIKLNDFKHSAKQKQNAFWKGKKDSKWQETYAYLSSIYPIHLKVPSLEHLKSTDLYNERYVRLLKITEEWGLLPEDSQIPRTISELRDAHNAQEHHQELEKIVTHIREKAKARLLHLPNSTRLALLHYCNQTRQLFSSSEEEQFKLDSNEHRYQNKEVNAANVYFRHLHRELAPQYYYVVKKADYALEDSALNFQYTETKAITEIAEPTLTTQQTEDEQKRIRYLQEKITKLAQETQNASSTADGTSEAEILNALTGCEEDYRELLKTINNKQSRKRLSKENREVLTTKARIAHKILCHTINEREKTLLLSVKAKHKDITKKFSAELDGYQKEKLDVLTSYYQQLNSLSQTLKVNNPQRDLGTRARHHLIYQLEKSKTAILSAIFEKMLFDLDLDHEKFTRKKSGIAYKASIGFLALAVLLYGGARGFDSVGSLLTALKVCTPHRAALFLGLSAIGAAVFFAMYLAFECKSLVNNSGVLEETASVDAEHYKQYLLMKLMQEATAKSLSQTEKKIDTAVTTHSQAKTYQANNIIDYINKKQTTLSRYNSALNTIYQAGMKRNIRHARSYQQGIENSTGRKVTTGLMTGLFATACGIFGGFLGLECIAVASPGFKIAAAFMIGASMSHPAIAALVLFGVIAIAGIAISSYLVKNHGRRFVDIFYGRKGMGEISAAESKEQNMERTQQEHTNRIDNLNEKKALNEVDKISQQEGAKELDRLTDDEISKLPQEKSNQLLKAAKQRESKIYKHARDGLFQGQNLPPSTLGQAGATALTPAAN